MDKAQAIEKIKKYKQLINNHFDIDKVFLFGSFANGTSRSDSDIDVAVIVKNLSGDYFATVPLLWKLRRQIDERIEPVLFDKNKDSSGFLSEILKNGIEIKD